MQCKHHREWKEKKNLHRNLFFLWKSTCKYWLKIFESPYTCSIHYQKKLTKNSWRDIKHSISFWLHIFSPPSVWERKRFYFELFSLDFLQLLLQWCFTTLMNLISIHKKSIQQWKKIEAKKLKLNAFYQLYHNSDKSVARQFFVQNSHVYRINRLLKISEFIFCFKL